MWYWRGILIYLNVVKHAHVRGLNTIQRYYWITNLKGVRRRTVTMWTSSLQFFCRLYQSRFLWLTDNSSPGINPLFLFFFFSTKNWRGKWRNKIMRNVQYFVLFFLGLTVTWSFDFYGVLLVCNLYHIGIHTVDISSRKAVVSNTKWKSLGKLGCYHWWIIFFECN